MRRRHTIAGTHPWLLKIPDREHTGTCCRRTSMPGCQVPPILLYKRCRSFCRVGYNLRNLFACHHKKKMFSAKVNLKFQDSMTGVTGGLRRIWLEGNHRLGMRNQTRKGFFKFGRAFISEFSVTRSISQTSFLSIVTSSFLFCVRPLW